MVSCTVVRGKDDRAPDPVVIVEVLSRSTEEFDRGRKWLQYQTLPSLQHYLLVSQDELRIDHYRRQGSDWYYTAATGPEAVVSLEHPAVELRAMDVFAGSSVAPSQ